MKHFIALALTGMGLYLFWCFAPPQVIQVFKNALKTHGVRIALYVIVLFVLFVFAIQHSSLQIV